MQLNVCDFSCSVSAPTLSSPTAGFVTVTEHQSLFENRALSATELGESTSRRRMANLPAHKLFTGQSE
jgi:hypothetical protein